MLFSILKFWLSRLSGGWKGKKWPKKTKISVCHTLYFRNHISYDVDLWYTCIHKRIISPGIFCIFLFSKFWFLGSLGWGEGGKKAKNGSKWQKNCVCLMPYLRNHTLYDCDFWYTCVKWWYLQQIFSFFKILIFGVFRGNKRAKNDLKLAISVCYALYLRNCRSYHQDFDNDIYMWFSFFLFSF